MNNIKIVYENNNLIIIDKPAGLLVHPTAAHEPNTVADWLMAKYPEIKNCDWPDKNRIGIVHRLDKDTSGLLILAKNPPMLKSLQEKFKKRQIKKTYRALVYGKVAPKTGKIKAAIIRDRRKNRQKIAEAAYSFTRGKIRPAVTKYKVLKYYRYKKDDLSLVEAYPQTGRLHQIRVHFKFIGHPIVGDQLYFIKPSKKLSKDLNINRQFLHTIMLQFDGREFTSDLSDNLKNVLTKLKIKI